MNIHPTALIDPKAILGQDVEIGPYTVIGPQVTLGDQVKIHAFVSLGAPSQDLKAINDGTNALHIGARTTIREHTSIHISSQPGHSTRIGEDCLIMGQVHIGHDCQIGNQVIISQGCGLSGHVIVEDQAVLGGMVGVHQQVHIGRMSMIGAKSGLVQDALPYSMVQGFPASVYGLNLFGLKRHSVYPEIRSQIKKAFQMIFKSTLLSQTLLELESFGSPEIQHIIGFIQKSERGFYRERIKRV